MKRLLFTILILSIAAAAWAYKVDQGEDTLPEFQIVENYNIGTELLSMYTHDGKLHIEISLDHLKQYIEREYILIPRIEYEQEKRREILK